MKWLTRIFYAVAVFIVGNLVFQTSMRARSENYFKFAEENYLKEGKTEEYINSLMTVSGTSKYNKEAIYTINSNDENYNFTIEFYHFEAYLQKEKSYGIIMFIKEFDLTNQEDVIGLNLEYIGQTQDIKETIMVPFIKGKDNLSNTGYTQIEPFFIFNEESKDYFGHFSSGKIKNEITFISELRFSFIRKDEKEEKINVDEKYFAVIKGNDKETEDFETITYTFELNGSILENNDISGNPKLYQKLQSLYENDHENIVKVNQDVLKEYNNVLVRNLTIYGVVATVVTFLLFFLKPIVELINKKKNNSEAKE